MKKLIAVVSLIVIAGGCAEPQSPLLPEPCQYQEPEKPVIENPHLEIQDIHNNG